MIRAIYFFIAITLLSNCSSTKKVYICGDHECVNKAEAKQYFDENLSLEIKIIDKNNVKSYDLVQLNREVADGKNNNLIKSTKEKLKIKKLSLKEVKIRKEEVNKKIKFAKLKKKREKQLIKKKDNNSLFKNIIKKSDTKNITAKKNDVLKIKKEKEVFDKKSENSKITLNKVKNIKIYTSEICPILSKCDIDSITKYLVKKGKEKKYPDISSKNK